MAKDRSGRTRMDGRRDDDGSPWAVRGEGIVDTGVRMAERIVGKAKDKVMKLTGEEARLEREEESKNLGTEGKKRLMEIRDRRRYRG